MQKHLAVLGLLALLCASARAEIKLELASQIHLPSDASGGSYGYGAGVAEQMIPDLENNILYVVGENGLMQVVDITDSKAMKVKTAVDIGGKATDVEFCGGYVGVGIGDGVTNGKVHIFKKYEEGMEMAPLYTLETGPLPDMIKFTKDCKMLFTANEGEGALTGSGFVNPEGSISVFTWEKEDDEDVKYADLSKEPTKKTITFEDIAGSASKAEKLWESGVAWSFGPHTPGFPEDKFPMSERSFIKSLEPEYLAISSDEKRLYVCLQESSAIAQINLDGDEMMVEGIYPLQKKYWNKGGMMMDPSDKDGEINMVKPPKKLVGFTHPDTIALFKIGANDYIATANEGDAVEYCEGDTCYAGDTRMEDVADKLDDDLAEDEDLVAAMKDDKQLGRLKLDIAGSLKNKDDKYSELHLLSTRSVSIYRADPTDGLRFQWDSGDQIESLHKTYYPEIFNSNGAEPGGKQSDEFDARSDDKGPEVETVATCEIDGRMLLFVGCERTSTVLVYDVTYPWDPTWQSIIAVGGQGTVPSELGSGSSTPAPSIGVVDPEAMYCDAENKRLIVSGSVSGVVAIYDITGETSGASATTTSFLTVLAALALSLFAVMRA